MRTGLTISGIGHAALLLWGVVAFAAKPYTSDVNETMPVDIISTTEFSQLTAGTQNAPQAEQSKPLVEKEGDKKPTEDPAAKVVDKKEITASTDQPPVPKPPKPEPKKAEPKPPEPKRDLIAEALKKDEAKKPAPKKAEAKPPMPPRKPAPEQPAFDPRKMQALLDKRAPQRLAATGDTLSSSVALGAPSGIAAQLSMSELDALRARLAQLWNPPAGAKDPSELVVQIRMKLNPDGTLAGPPMVLTSGRSPLFMISRERAISAILRGQPFNMLRPEHYEQWKDVEITFDPRHMLRG